MPDLEMNLIENALDFLDEAADSLLQENASPRKIKYAVLHVASGIELLLKQRLVDEDWRLIVSKKQENGIVITEENFYAGVLNTITPKKAENLLSNNFKVDLSPHTTSLAELRETRNRIQHLSVNIERTATLSRLYQIWSFVEYFVENHLNLLEHDLGEKYEGVRQKLYQLKQYVEHRIEEIQPELERYRIEEEKIIVECPSCGREALPLGNGVMTCVCCKSEYTPDTLRDDWVRTVAQRNMDLKDIYSDYALSGCPTCEQESLFANFGENETIPIDYFCFSCGSYWSRDQIMDCIVCGDPFPHNGDTLNICPNCLEMKINGSD